MTTPVIAVIGAGNMGSSIIGGLINHGHPGDKLWATDSSEEKLVALQNTFHIQTTTANEQAVQRADIVILAIKPQLFVQVVPTLASTVQAHQPLIISIAAGIRIAPIQHWLGDKVAIVRAMPNLPAIIGCGATALYPNRYVTPEQHNQAESILRAVGVTVWLTHEDLMDAVTALSGNGPAYFFLVMEALQAAAEEMGLPNEMAGLLVLQTALGAARLAIESGTPLPALRRNVTSPGGTTEKAVSVLEEHNIRDLFKKALQAGKQRSEELACLLDKQ